MSNIYGIDVSAWQGVIDWAKVKKAGCGHAVLKINMKNLAVDKQFAANIKGCKAQGIPYGVYRYVYESTEAAAKKAAHAVVATLKQYDAAPGTIVWWDVEDASIKAAAKTTLTASILAAQKVIEAAGYGFGVYCGKYWYDSVLQTGKLTCPFWIARYPSTNAVAFGTAPSAQYKPITTQPLWGWQYSSKGVVPGISGNECVRRRAGGRWRFRARDRSGCAGVSAPAWTGRGWYHGTGDTQGARGVNPSKSTSLEWSFPKWKRPFS